MNNINNPQNSSWMSITKKINMPPFQSKDVASILNNSPVILSVTPVFSKITCESLMYAKLFWDCVIFSLRRGVIIQMPNVKISVLLMEKKWKEICVCVSSLILIIWIMITLYPPILIMMLNTFSNSTTFVLADSNNGLRNVQSGLIFLKSLTDQVTF